MSFINNYFETCCKAIKEIDQEKVNQAISLLETTRRKNGRLFVLGVGGSSANASHAVNDFRKLCAIEAYCPTDNVSELTAVTNDEGFEFIFKRYLQCSKLTENDLLLIFSVGGGCSTNRLSENLIKAIDYANQLGSKSIAIVGKERGYAARFSSVPIVIPVGEKELITPVSEALQAVIWHGFVTDPRLQNKKSTWTSIDETVAMRVETL